MAWSGSSFVRALGSSQWANDAAANVGIQAGIHDTQDNDLAGGIDACINKNGANTPTVNLSMGGFAHTNVAAATLRSQYMQVGQSQDGFGMWCGTSGGSANAQTLTPTPAILAGAAGQMFSFLAGFTNSAAATIAISGLGALSVYRPDGRALLAGDITAGQVYTVLNDGASRLICLNVTPKWISYSPSVSGFSVNPANGMYRYILYGNQCTVAFNTGTPGTSNANNYSIDAPIVAATVTNGVWFNALAVTINNGAHAADGYAFVNSAGSFIGFGLAGNVTGWTAANGKAAYGEITYEIASP
jgi:hypothetical protein